LFSSLFRLTVRHLVFHCLPLFIILTVAAPAGSQTSSEAPPAPATGPPAVKGAEVVLEDVVVTAERAETPFLTGDVDPELTPTFFSVVKRDEFEGKMESLGEVLEKEAGVTMRTTGGVGGYSVVSIRGSAENQVMVFLDGILLNEGAGGGVNLGNISLSDVEAVEIYRGATPVNFAQASIGGVVNIRTLRRKGGFKANVGAVGGSFETVNAFGYVNHKPGRFDYLFSFDYLQSENNYRILNGNGTPHVDADDRWEDRRNSQVDQYNVTAKFGYDLTDDLRVDLLEQFFYKDQGVPAWNNNPFNDAALDTRRNTSSLRLTRDGLGPFNLAINYNLVWQEEEYDDRNGYVGFGKQHNRYETTRHGGGFYAEWLSTWNIVSLNVDYKREAYRPENLLNDEALQDSNRETWNVALQDNLLLFGERIVLTPALRYTAIDNTREKATAKWGQDFDRLNASKDYWKPQAGIKYKPWPWLAFKANYAEYVREPSYLEMFGDRGFTRPNAQLEPEEGVNWDVGFEIDYVPDPWWLGRVSVSGAYFATDLENGIVWVYNSAGVGQAVNIANADISGFEAGFGIDFLKCFTLTLRGAWQDTENRSTGTYDVFYGNALPGRWAFSYSGRLESRYKGLEIYYEHLVEQDMFYDRANLLDADDKSIGNAGVSFLWRDFKFSFEVKNVGHEHHQDFSGWQSPGRSFWIGVKYNR